MVIEKGKSCLCVSVLLLAVAALLVGGCSSSSKIEISSGCSPACTSLDVNNSDSKFHFAIVTDLHGGGREGVFPVAVKGLNLMQPEFVMSVGDLVNGYTTYESAINSQWDEFDLMVAELEMPFFYTAGNHDLTNPAMAKVWESRLGRSYYHFIYKGVLFLCLNTEDQTPGNISDQQVEYVSKVLSDNADVKWTFVFMHKPLWDYKSPSGFAEIEKLLSGRKYSVYAGHYHNYVMSQRNGANYYILATTGGGSKLRGDMYGEFDHFVWMTFTDNGPVMTNILLDGFRDHDVRPESVNDFVDGIDTKGVIVAAALLDEDVFTQAAVTAQFYNPAGVPVTYSGKISCNDGISVNPDVFELVVQPGKTAGLLLDIKADTEIPVEQVGKITLNWQAAAKLPDYAGDAVITGTIDIPVERVRPSARADAAIVIDGKLDEWLDLPVSVNSLQGGETDEFATYWDGPQDASYSFGTCYDDKYLYIAASVTDNEIMADAAQEYWKQDSLELWLDIRSRPDRETTPAVSGKRKVCGVLAGGKSTNAPDGFLTASTITEGGYCVEFAVPLSYLTDLQGENWDGFRINMVQFDYDSDNFLQLWYRQSWRSIQAASGAGSFMKQ